MVLRPSLMDGYAAKTPKGKKQPKTDESAEHTRANTPKQTKIKNTAEKTEIAATDDVVTKPKPCKTKRKAPNADEDSKDAALQRELYPTKRVRTLEPVTFDPADLRPFPKTFAVSPGTLDPAQAAEYLQKHTVRVEGMDKPPVLGTFDAACLTEAMRSVLTAQGIATPTPIQAVAMPLVLLGRDCVGLAETGSGKTLAYVLPCVVHINAQPRTKIGDGPIALVLCPTRELAMQINDQFGPFGQQRPRFRTIVIYGGTELTEEQKDLKYSMQVCVATPGRLTQYLWQTNLKVRRVTFLVLDEADRMLDMGFGPQLSTIASQLRPDRQTVMWSATWPPGVQQLAAEYLRDPVVVVANDVDRLSANRAVAQLFHFPTFGKKKLHLDVELKKQDRQRLEQEHRYMPESKQHFLRKLIANLRWKSPTCNKTIVFVRTRVACRVLQEHFVAHGLPSLAIHSGVSQTARVQRLRDFRKDPCGLLLATDVASRGIDVPDTKYIINADMPTCLEVYVHRIGRTARAKGLTGEAHSIMHPKDYILAKPLVRVLQEAGQGVPPQILAWAEGTNLPSYDPRTNRMLHWLRDKEMRKEEIRVGHQTMVTADDPNISSATEYADVLRQFKTEASEATATSCPSAQNVTTESKSEEPQPKQKRPRTRA